MEQAPFLQATRELAIQRKLWAKQCKEMPKTFDRVPKLQRSQAAALLKLKTWQAQLEMEA